MTKKKNKEEQKDRRQVHKLSGDEKTTEEQLNNATSLHSSVFYRPPILPGVLSILTSLLQTFINDVDL